MNYSAKVSNKVERASNVLEIKVRLNRSTGNRGKRIGWTKHDETGNEADGAGRTGAQRNRERNGLAKTRVGKGRRNGRDGNAERATHEETGNETDRTEALGE